MPRQRIYNMQSIMRQTTPMVVFREGRMGPNPGRYPNPLIGWRKEQNCKCPQITKIIKNNCCQPPVRKIQNKNGEINQTYSYTHRGYLQKRCNTFEQNAFNFMDLSNNINYKYCCIDDCSGISRVGWGHMTSTVYAPIVNYKRSNEQFRKQGAVTPSERILRLKYNTIISQNPVGKLYVGGQIGPTTNPLYKKSRTSCFCTIHGKKCRPEEKCKKN